VSVIAHKANLFFGLDKVVAYYGLRVAEE